MIYTVKMQADRTQQWVDIYGPSKELSLLSPKVKVELNSAGSFTFVLPPNHTYYALPKILLTNIAVWEENNLIFFGRVSEIEVDFYKQKTIHAEGALAFLNDTIQRPAEWEVTSVRTFVNYILAQHNNQVPSDRRIQLHHVDDNIGNKTVYRKLDYETTFDALKKMCLEAEGGYLFINVAIDSSTGESTLTMDWLEGLETSGNEPIQYAVNLVDLKQTYGILQKVEERIKDIPQVRLYSKVAGNSTSFDQSSSNGNFTLKLKNWKERKGSDDDINSVMEEVYRRTADISNAKIQVNTQAMIPGFGRTNGFELYIQDKHGGTIEELQLWTERLIAALNQREEVSRAFTNFSLKYPQYRLEVDAARCKQNGVSPSDVLSVLSGYVGGIYASNFNRFTKLYRVMVQASPEYRLSTESLNNMFVASKSGTMSPIGQYVRLTRVYGSETLSRFNLFPSISVSGVAADGYSSGQMIQAIREEAANVLPEGYGYEFGGMTREESTTSNTTTLVFIICIVFIYLILCALYENLFVPLAVILSVPFGLAGSFIFAKIWGLENNIYMQTGLIMLIGLLSKTAILLTEYASERRKHGMSIVQAALSAAVVRLRPILMTSLTMIFGLLPLAFSTGVGANGNRSLGVGTIGGMLIGTIALLFIVPLLFIVFQWIEEKVFPKRTHQLNP